MPFITVDTHAISCNPGGGISDILGIREQEFDVGDAVGQGALFEAAKAFCVGNYCLHRRG